MARSSQQGAALIMALVMLIVMTLIAISSMQDSILQERMASAQREGTLALTIGESGLSDATGVLMALPDLTNFGNTVGYYQTGNAPDPFDDDTWNPSNNASIEAATSINGVSSRYFIEYMGPYILTQTPSQGSKAPEQLESARVVVMSQGPSGTSRRVLESFIVFDPDS